MVNRRQKLQTKNTAFTVEIKIWKDFMRKNETIIFLSRVCDKGYVLPTYSRKNMPLIYSLNWQEDALKILKSEVSKSRRNTNCKPAWRKLPQLVKDHLKFYQFRRKNKYIQKFNKINKNENSPKIAKKRNEKDPKKTRTKRDRIRYKTKIKDKLLENCKKKILNYSDFKLTPNMYAVLGKGFGFVPIPDTSTLKHSEFCQAIEHIRRCEWNDIYRTEQNDEIENEPENGFENLPEKLKIKKFSRPPTNLLSEQQKAYSEAVISGMRKFSTWSNLDKKNLSVGERKALKILSKKANKEIMIGPSDKDSKLIICNLADYTRIVSKSVKENFEIMKLPTKKEELQIKEYLRENVIELHKNEIISNKELLGSVGLNFKQRSNEYSPTRRYASQFSVNFESDAAYVYPLWKTHKRDHFEKIDEIPIRLVTAAQSLPTSKTMALLERIVQPFMVSYCGSEYTKDSGDYIQSLLQNDIYNTDNLAILCFDVEKLYPSANRELVILAVDECLTLGGLNRNTIEAIKNLTKTCMEHIYVKWGGEFWGATSGILTGGGNSVTLANCLLRYITRRLNLKLTILWKRYIDDIITMLQNKTQKKILRFIQEVKTHFKLYNFNLTVRLLNPQNNTNLETSIEYLDVDHKFSKGKLETLIFVKPTASGATYLDPASYHPQYTAKGILLSEAIRARRICSTTGNFKTTLNNIENKAKKSNFSNKTIKLNNEKVSNWNNDKRIELLEPKIYENQENCEKAIWVSSIPEKVKENFSTFAKYLPKAAKWMVAYKKPPSIRSILFKPRTLGKDTEGTSEGCGRCKLCGSREKKNWRSMVHKVNSFESEVGKKIKLTKKLNCSNSGIYFAQCEICQNGYVGQCSTCFSTRWNGHRAAWKGSILKNTAIDESSDKTALVDHYKKKHASILNSLVKNNITFGFDKSFKVIFIDDNTNSNLLDKKEDFWKVKTKASINRSKIITPFY